MPASVCLTADLYSLVICAESHVEQVEEQDPCPPPYLCQLHLKIQDLNYFIHHFRSIFVCTFFFKLKFFFSFCFFTFGGFGRIEMRETIAFCRPQTQIIHSRPSIPRLAFCLNSVLSYGRILRKESLVVCLAILLFSSQLLSLFQMSTEMLENPSIKISTFTG